MANCGLLTHPMNSKILTCLFKEISGTIMALGITVNISYLVFLNTATSFLKACNWAGVGSLTLRVLTATGPCQWPRYTVPNEPDPIRGPIKISSAGISQSSIDSRDARTYQSTNTMTIIITQMVNLYLFINEILFDVKMIREIRKERKEKIKSEKYLFIAFVSTSGSRSERPKCVGGTSLGTVTVRWFRGTATRTANAT